MCCLPCRAPWIGRTQECEGDCGLDDRRDADCVWGYQNQMKHTVTFELLSAMADGSRWSSPSISFRSPATWIADRSVRRGAALAIVGCGCLPRGGVRMAHGLHCRRIAGRTDGVSRPSRDKGTACPLWISATVAADAGGGFVAAIPELLRKPTYVDLVLATTVFFFVVGSVILFIPAHMIRA